MLVVAVVVVMVVLLLLVVVLVLVWLLLFCTVADASSGLLVRKEVTATPTATSAADQDNCYSGDSVVDHCQRSPHMAKINDQ